jgi:hypothetical protein
MAGLPLRRQGQLRVRGNPKAYQARPRCRLEERGQCLTDVITTTVEDGAIPSWATQAGWSKRTELCKPNPAAAKPAAAQDADREWRFAYKESGRQDGRPKRIIVKLI